MSNAHFHAAAYALAASMLVLCLAGCSNDASRASLPSPSASATLSASSTNEQAGESPGSGAVVPSASLDLIVQGDPVLYSYEDLLSDVEAMAEGYPSWVSSDSLGVTADGREILHMVIGNPDATRRILITGGIHAREYMTTQLVMKQAAAFLEHARTDAARGATSYRSVLENTAIHVVPAVNPDGETISQYGLDGMRSQAVRDKLVSIAALDGAAPDYEYFRSWKANANGVDLNRQFDALWAEFQGTSHPSSDRYKGTAPGSEVESRALIDLTERERFDRTISYHTHGSVIYWYFAQTGELYDDTLAFAHDISAATGYPLDANYEALDPAGYKDWAIQSKGIPSLTIEVGVAPTPVPPEQFPTIWAQNEHVWETTLEM
ncbi:MAG: hypothetical protein IJ087_21320 [Eggerthellaceae bacterium]|nr:hypothetical protein [Eggerthellaceae bacterium]